MGVEPQHACDAKGINPFASPPRCLIAAEIARGFAQSAGDAGPMGVARRQDMVIGRRIGYDRGRESDAALEW
jgi:hypothetical protein